MNTTIDARELIHRLGCLGDENRLRILALLDRYELTVGELTAVLGMPQSTVSRHLKTLTDDGWIRGRQEGTRRHYRIASGLDPGASELWDVVRAQLEAPWIEEDGERAREVVAGRRRRVREFFSETAAGWDALRAELFGRHSETAALYGLLNPDWVVGDLGTGTGALAEAVAPFVRKVVAVDGSPEMLEAARSRLADYANVDLREGELEALPVESGSLDVAVLMLVLPWLAEPWRAIEEAARSLRPGGRLVIVDLREHARESYRETMGHQWLGFDEGCLREWVEGAGLSGYRYTGVRPALDTSGPLLFVGRATKPKDAETRESRRSDG